MKNQVVSIMLSILFVFSFACKKGGPITETAQVPGKENLDSTGQMVNKGNGNKYRMRILTQPEVIEAGKKAVISFTPQIVGRETEPVPLDADRGYEIHLIMVSNDLSWFDHRHPGLSDLGTYEQAYTFDKGGEYLLYAEYKPTGSVDTFQMTSIPVNGSSSRMITYTKPVLSSNAGPYVVTITPGQGGKFESGKMQEINATITKDNIPVDPNSLGDYLGSKGHMVLIGVKDKDFLHVHPAVDNGNLMFHAQFGQPGIYRAWIQFQTENIVQTADFVIQVEQGSSSE